MEVAFCVTHILLIRVAQSWVPTILDNRIKEENKKSKPEKDRFLSVLSFYHQKTVFLWRCMNTAQKEAKPYQEEAVRHEQLEAIEADLDVALYIYIIYVE